MSEEIVGTELAVNSHAMTIDAVMKYADVFVRSKRFANDTDVYQASVKIQAGKELGLQPIQSMNNIVIVNGRITLGAALVGALIKASGRYWFKVLEHTNEVCSIEFLEKFNGEWISCGTSIFTMEDAKAAGLTGKDVWKKFPRNMLHSRAITNGARWYTPDVFGGPIYTPEELENDIVNGSQSDIKVEMAKPDPEKMSWQDFVATVGLEENELKAQLKAGGFAGWVAGKRQAMFDYIEEYKKTKVDTTADIILDGELA